MGYTRKKFLNLIWEYLTDLNMVLKRKKKDFFTCKMLTNKGFLI